MGLFQRIKRLFKEEKLKARNFVEIFRSEDINAVNTVKVKLEKYKIPVYVVNKKLHINDNEMLYILRIPEQFSEQAKSLLNA
jgi:hypothetical protein